MARVDTSSPRMLKIILKGEVYEFDVQGMLRTTGNLKEDFERTMQDHAYVAAMLADVRTMRLKVKNSLPQIRSRIFLSFKTDPQNFAAKFNPEIRKVTESEADAASRCDSAVVAVQDEEAELDAAFASLETMLKQLDMKFNCLEDLSANIRTDKRGAYTHGDR